MRSLAVYNFKGGVGKTTTAVHLAYLAAEGGARTLLWDLDPQGAASYFYRVSGKEKAGVKRLLGGDRELAELVRASDYERLYVLPADFSYRKLDVALAETKRPSERFAGLLAPLVREFDIVFFDCPPSLSMLAETIFALADAVLVPTLPTPLSVRALAQIAEHLEKKGLGDLPVLAFRSMVDRRKALHRETAWFEQRMPFTLLDAEIPYASLLEEAAVRRQPIFAFAPNAPPARAYRQLWREVAGRV
jgi:chromosome partitioning protein